MDPLANLDFGKSALQVLQALESAGHEAWLVGGCVRDSIAGRKVNDIDIASSATWQEVDDICSRNGMGAYETGTAHGTITVVCDGAPFEVTTFRTDSATSSDSRHPDRVEFVSSIEEDLARRDFTINAMAWHPDRGLVDLFGGAEDLARRVIRVVGNPRERFREDALRILRACRFSSELGFEIDSETYEAMLFCKHLLSKVSKERITYELDRFLLGSHVHDALMSTVDVLSFALPELAAMKACPQITKYHSYDVLEHTAWAVQNAAPERLVRWAALCHDMGKPAAAFFDADGVEHFYGHAFISAELAWQLTGRLLMENSFRSDLVTMIRDHSSVITGDRRVVKRALSRMAGSPDLLRSLLKLKRADILSHAPEYRSTDVIDDAERTLDMILEHGEAFLVKHLAIDGHDVMSLGIGPGPDVGEALRSALDAVIEGTVENDRSALISFVSSLNL